MFLPFLLGEEEKAENCVGVGKILRNGEKKHCMKVSVCARMFCNSKKVEREILKETDVN